MCSEKGSTIYHSSTGQDRSDHLVTGHTFVDGRRGLITYQRIDVFQLVLKKMKNNYDDDDDGTTLAWRT